MVFNIEYLESGIEGSKEIARGAQIDCLTTKQSVFVPLLPCSLKSIKNRVESIKRDIIKGVYNSGLNVKDLIPKNIR